MARSRKGKIKYQKGRSKPKHPAGSQPEERNLKRSLARQSSVQNRPAESSTPDRKPLKKLLEGIGTPEPAPLVPDDFQTEALEAIGSEDVLVTAPTGSGKTWIAREEIRRLLQNGQRAWYTSPLKALTNSK